MQSSFVRLFMLTSSQYFMVKKLVIGSALAVIFLAGVGGAIWSLGSVPAEVKRGVTLTVERPQVEVRKGGQGEWHEVTSETSLEESDEVRTGTNGRAIIRFFENGETRLRESSSVKIEQAYAEAGQGSSLSVSVGLLGGRVWSRVLRLFDLDSSFSVRTDTVVATVRGTAFDVGLDASGTTMWVADSAVQMEIDPRITNKPLSSTNGLMVPEGFTANVSLQGKTGEVQPMTDTDTATDWFRRNVVADTAFEKDVREMIAARFERAGAVHPDSAFDSFVRFSERLHLAFADSEAPDLYATYLGRRLYAIKTLIDGGKSGLGLQAFMGLENDVKKILKTPEGKTYLPPMRATLADMMVLLSDIGPSSPLYRLRQRLEDLNQLIAGEDRAAQLYARLLAIDSRLSVTSQLISANALEEAGISLEGARQGIGNAERDLGQISPAMKEARVLLLRDKLDALKVREGVMVLRLQTALAPVTSPEDPHGADGSVTSTTGTLETGPVPQIENPVPTTTPPTPTSSREPPVLTQSPLTSLTLAAQPNPVIVGSMAQLRVTGTRADGSTEDLTSRASFLLSNSLGTLNGPTYTATQSGSVVVQASVVEYGLTVQAQTTLQVTDAVVLSKIDVVPQGSTTVSPGQTVPVVVTATYTNGFTAIVTSQATWVTSDANIGSVTNGIFTAWVNGQGSVTITASYTEGGITKTANLPFTVTPPTSNPTSPSTSSRTSG